MGALCRRVKVRRAVARIQNRLASMAFNAWAGNVAELLANRAKVARALGEPPTGRTLSHPDDYFSNTNRHSHRLPRNMKTGEQCAARNLVRDRIVTPPHPAV